jgi:aconitate hydratase
MTFSDETDYDSIDTEDELVMKDARTQVSGSSELVIINKTKNKEIKVKAALSGRQVEMVLAGGLLNYTKKQSE